VPGAHPAYRHRGRRKPAFVSAPVPVFPPSTAGRQERPAWVGGQSAGAERDVPQETACLPRKYVAASLCPSLPSCAALTDNFNATELQGHAIKNQDLMIASGTVSLKGSEGLSAVDDDVEAAASVSRHTAALPSLTTNTNLCASVKQSRQAQVQVQGEDVNFRHRNRELNEIANSIAQLAELFRELSALVIDQGTLLDSVEYNIEQTTVQMQEAVKELDVATRLALSFIASNRLRLVIEPAACLLYRLPMITQFLWIIFAR
jgi:hypothetical protein